MILPSMKLLAEVFNDIDLSEDRYEFEQYTNILVYTDIHGNTERYSVHDLMHLMKEWIRDKEYRYDIKTYMLHRKITINLYKNTSSFPCKSINIEPTEFEAVTKACEWILNERI